MEQKVTNTSSDKKARVAEGGRGNKEPNIRHARWIVIVAPSIQAPPALKDYVCDDINNPEGSLLGKSSHRS